LTLLVKEFNGLQPGVPLYVVKLAGLAAKMMQALRALGIDIDAESGPLPRLTLARPRSCPKSRAPTPASTTNTPTR
jgi:hypothetical protein